MPRCRTRLPIRAGLRRTRPVAPGSTRAGIGAGTRAAVPPGAGMPDSAAQHLGGPGDTIRETARTGLRHRHDVARHTGRGPALAVPPVACGTARVCAPNFDPDLLAAARAAEAATPHAPLCGRG